MFWMSALGLEDAGKKLSLRARLPGARVYDLAAHALRSVTGPDARFTLALPASWLVNSPAPSPILRRWALPPSRDVFIALASAVANWPAERDIAVECLGELGDEPFVVEAVSKVLALLAPSSVPLMPAPARTFVLGADASDAAAFTAMIDWFQETARTNASTLDAAARAHTEVELTGPQVLDRVLWFDSEGHRHFEAT